MRLKDIFEASPEERDAERRAAAAASSRLSRPPRQGQTVSGPDAVRTGATGNQAFVSSLSGPGVTSSNLRRGSTGTDVSSLQQMLIDKGYNLGDTGADGKFGPRTAAAVRQFQTDFGLQADGIAGDQTMSALNKLGAKPAAAPAPGRVDRDQQGSITRPTTPTALPTRPGQDRSGPPAALPTRPGQDRSGPPAALPTRPGQDRSGPPAALPTRPGQNVSGPITGGLPTRPGQNVSGPRNRRRF
jgi:peptidoglycan hydrolase-like protein with peptidoglycan-binding domain